jgi:hypothetical protein
MPVRSDVHGHSLFEEDLRRVAGGEAPEDGIPTEYLDGQIDGAQFDEAPGQLDAEQRLTAFLWADY